MIGVYFPGSAITAEQYKSVDDRLKASGPPPAALKMHTCFQEGDSLAIFDVWDSKEAFEESFADQLKPIVDELGLPLSTPTFVEMIVFEVP